MIGDWCGDGCRNSTVGKELRCLLGSVLRNGKQSLANVVELSTRGEMLGAALQVCRVFMFATGANVVKCCNLHDVKRKRHHVTVVSPRQLAGA